VIIAQQKPLNEIQDMLISYNKVLLVGCGSCVALCSAGGPGEVARMADELLAQNNDLKITKTITPRQCVERFLDRLQEQASTCDAIVSMACGNGVQAMAKRFPEKPVFPALNTQFIGIKEEPGVWAEMCMACGDCILWRTGGICPMARCAKSLLNGACGGASEGRCEVSKDRPCAWQEIYHALKRLNRLDRLRQKPAVKAWSVRPGRVVREDLRNMGAT
jgi:ferredoxin